VQILRVKFDPGTGAPAVAAGFPTVADIHVIVLEDAVNPCHAVAK
jgi:hypothetical protein